MKRGIVNLAMARASHVRELMPYPVLWVMIGVLCLSAFTWCLAQTSLARQRLGQVTVFLTAGQVILLMQLMAALKNIDAWFFESLTQRSSMLCMLSLPRGFYVDRPGIFVVSSKRCGSKVLRPRA